MEIKGEQKVTIIGLMVAVAVGSAVYFFNHAVCPAKPSQLLDQPEKVFEAKSDPSLVVHVCGAVRREGVYRMRAGDRVLDAVRMAGGAVINADLSALNLAEEIKDGVKITVPQKVQIIASGTVSGQKSGSMPENAKIVNINTASAGELDALPGIGPATAQKIIEARPFSKPEDLIKIPRFGKSKFDKIKDRVCI